MVQPVFQDGPEAHETLSTQPQEMQEVWPSVKAEYQKIPKLKLESGGVPGVKTGTYPSF